MSNLSEEEIKEYDFIVGFTLFTPKGFRTMYRHFDSLEVAKMFASNVNIKDNHKIYVDFDLYNKEIEELKKENLEIRDWKYVIDSPIDLDKLKELDSIKIKGKEYVSKDKLIELREIDNIDLIQCKLRKLLEDKKCKY